jgi:hypothetical protein
MDRLLARHGLDRNDAPDSHAGRLLRAALAQMGSMGGRPDEAEESRWMEALDRAARRMDSRGGEHLADPRTDELPLAAIDPHLRGVVRWMNALGIHTASCCDGHGKREPRVSLLHPPGEQELRLLRSLLPDGLRLRRRWDRTLIFECDDPPLARPLLLDYAELLHGLLRDPERRARIEAEGFKERHLLDLLDVPGASGHEGPVRRFLLSRLRRIADRVEADDAGNVLAVIRQGDGPVVLLSAHMDVYSEIVPGRRILQMGNVLRSSEGILGADDRAGIAIVLHVAERIRRTDFCGTLKLAFTVREEIGLVGASRIDAAFLRDVDAAIVIDRRGNRDIVTSCGGAVPFCEPSYGRLYEEAGVLAGMTGWRVTAGGSSDAVVFARDFGINTVNLSAGYRHEHTDREMLDVVAAYETAKLVETVLHRRMIESWANSRPA